MAGHVASTDVTSTCTSTSSLVSSAYALAPRSQAPETKLTLSSSPPGATCTLLIWVVSWVEIGPLDSLTIGSGEVNVTIPGGGEKTTSGETPEARRGLPPG